MPVKVTTRTTEVARELRSASEALDQAIDNLEAAQARYDLSLTRFRSAYDMLLQEKAFTRTRKGNMNLADWLRQFPFIRRHMFTAESLGEAILFILSTAEESMSRFDIILGLRRGGYQFKSSPIREVRTALLNLKSVTEIHGEYTWEEPEELEDD